MAADTDIYLDIDGVLLANDVQPALFAGEFIRYVLREFPDTTYWLTTHCQGDARVPVRHIGHMFEPDVQALLERIKPTAWETAKTRAIDFSRPFLWFDDDLFDEEQQALVQHGALDNWIQVDLVKDPEALAKFIASFPLPATAYRS